MSKNKTKNNVLSAQAEKQLLNQLANNGVITRNVAKKKKKRTKRSSFNNFGNLVQSPVSTTRETRANNKRPDVFHTGPQREFVTTLLGSTGNFELKLSLAINAGNPSFSPWLAGLARQYESYKFKYLRVKYVARCPTSQPGWVAISPDCNPHDPAPQSEIQAFQNKNTVSQAPYKEFEVRFDSNMLSKRKSYFCRKDGALPAGADKDLYDIGNIFILVGGTATGNPLGQIWVEYDCEFHTPEFADSANNTTFVRATTGLNAANPFGDVGRLINQVGDVLQVSSPDTMTFLKSFHGMINMNHTGTGLLGSPSINPASTVTYNEIETANMTMAGFVSTGSYLSSLISANSGDILRMLGPSGGVITRADISLTPCLL